MPNMQVPPPIKEFLRWRWSPCVALTAGSLAFVALAVLLIPGQVDGEPRQQLSVFDRPRAAPTAMLNASLAQGVSMTERAAEDVSEPRLREQPIAMPRAPAPPIERAEVVTPPPPPVSPPAEVAPPPPPQIAPPLPAVTQEAAPPPAPDPDGPRRNNLPP
jgi:hypothetical protein